MALHAVTPARATARVVSNFVSHNIAERACSVARHEHDWQTEMKLRHNAEPVRRNMEAKGYARQGGEPCFSPWQGHGQLLGLAQAQAAEGPLHGQVPGQLAPSGRRRHWDTHVVDVMACGRPKFILQTREPFLARRLSWPTFDNLCYVRLSPK